MVGELVVAPRTIGGRPVNIYVQRPLRETAAAIIVRLIETTDCYDLAGVGVTNTYAPRRPDESHTATPSAVGADTVFQVDVDISGGPTPTVRFEPEARVCHIYTTMAAMGTPASVSSRHTVSQLHELYFIVDVFQALDGTVAGRSPRYRRGPTGHPLAASTWPRADFVEVYSPAIVAGRSLETLATPGTTALRRLSDGSVVQLGRFDGYSDLERRGRTRRRVYETGWVELPADPPPGPAGDQPGDELAPDVPGVLEYVGNWDFPTARELLSPADPQGHHHGHTEELVRLLADDRLRVRREAAWAVARFAYEPYADCLGPLRRDGHPSVRRAIADGKRTTSR